MSQQIDVFEPVELAGIKFGNRVLRAATDEGLADAAGNPTEKLPKLYENLAKGGVGGIITGFMSVSADGKSVMPGMILIESDERIAGLAAVVDRVHAAGVPIIAQLAHCGRNGVAGKAFNVNKLPESTLARVKSDFVAATLRAQKAGYDGAELHLAHGYFLSEMLSGHTNKRRDAWGGSLENRARLVTEILAEIRKQLPDYPVFVKVNGEENPKDGVHAEEAAAIAKLLEKAGVSGIEVSRGIDFKQMGPALGKIPADFLVQTYPGLKELPTPVKAVVKPLLPLLMDEQKPAVKYNVPAAKTIKAAVNIPVFAVGGIHDLAEIESTINEDGLDLVSMSRPLILEPGLIAKFKAQKATQARCLSCNYCLAGLYRDPLRCYYGTMPKATATTK